MNMRSVERSAWTQACHDISDGLNVAHRCERYDRQHMIGDSVAVDHRRPRSGDAVRVARSLSCADRRQSPLLRHGSQRRPSVAQCTSAITVSCAVRADVGRRALRTETEKGLMQKTFFDIKHRLLSALDDEYNVRHYYFLQTPVLLFFIFLLLLLHILCIFYFKRYSCCKV